jgi:hypothetical protein
MELVGDTPYSGLGVHSQGALLRKVECLSHLIKSISSFLAEFAWPDLIGKLHGDQYSNDSVER